MNRRSFIHKTGAAGLITLFSSSDIIQSFEPYSGSALDDNFVTPPQSTYPQAYWFWMNGNVTKEGITLDLEAMKNVGVGGVFNFDVGTGIPKGPVEYLSAQWLELKKHALSEADRLGLDFTMHNCPGWSASGGPWISPDMAMQQITWSETYVSGGGEVNVKLPKPPSRLDHYRDISILAFPSLEGEQLLQLIKLTTSSGSGEIKNLHTDEGVISGQAPDNKSAWLQFEFTEPYEASLLTFFISAIASDGPVSRSLEFGERTSINVEASDDGSQFRLVTTINTGLETELLIGDKYIAFDIPVTKAKYFRLSSAKARRYRHVRLSGITRLKN
ncbi:MAG TPA: glycosyl hydrolase, partial [Chitinophagaceae bacterium]